MHQLERLCQRTHLRPHERHLPGVGRHGPGLEALARLAGCVPYAVCDPNSDLCIARPEVGDFCNSVGPSCLTGSCDLTSSTCVLLPTAGACP